MTPVPESLGCSVCLLPYNLTDRLPKILVCQHSMCGQCVHTLTQGPSINCPTCRKSSQAGQVTVEFILTDALRSLCEECRSKSKMQQCPHCNMDLCAVCLETHSKDVHKKLLLGLAKLDQAIRQATYVGNDDSFVEGEQLKEKDTIDEIRQAIQYHRDALDKLEKKLEGEVKKSKQQNVDALMHFKTSLNEKITSLRSFSEQTKMEGGLIFNNQTPIEDMLKMQEKCEDLLKELNQQMNNKPALDDYKFVKSSWKLDPVSVGEFKRDAISRMAEADRQIVPDYTTLRYETLTGSKGAGLHQVDKPSRVVCTPDGAILTDSMNHRLKIYDTNLNRRFVIGEKSPGKKQAFCPTGVALGPGGDIYVSELVNHRITVLSPSGEFLRKFGSEGSGKEQFKYPHGIVVHDGYVYIADARNYRVKVVKTDGSFVRQIGSKGSSSGQFENSPMCVAVSPGDGRVLVNEANKRQLHVYSRAGEYQGLFPPIIPTQLARALINDMAVDTAGNVIVTYNAHKLAVYNRRGDLTTIVGSEGSKPGQLAHPVGVSVDTAAGRVLVCDTQNNRVQMFKFDLK